MNFRGEPIMNKITLAVRDCLQKSVADNIDNYSVKCHGGNEKGEGFLGDFLFTTLTHRKTSETLHLAIKQALPSKTDVSLNFVSNAFHNELWFYDKVWPAFRRFQDSFSDVEQFLKIPKHYATDTKRGAEKIVLENLAQQGFRNHNKNDCYEEDHLEYILRSYAQFHALSMAFRVSDPGNFRKVTEPLVDNSAAISRLRLYQRIINQGCQDILATFDKESEAGIQEKFKVYAEKGADILEGITNYTGRNQAVMHGDCWSNNIMFKYDEYNNIEDIRLIDFQFTKLGTVVYDLSYFIYASVSKEILDHLDHYLSIYHQSLSECLRGYKLDPFVLYSYEVFMQEWKQYSKFGVIMALLLNSGKNMDLKSMPSLTDLIDEEENRDVNENTTAPKSDQFFNFGRTLVSHAYNNDYL